MIGHCEVLNYIIEHSITFAGESTHNEREKEMYRLQLEQEE